jgi:chorismate-pyruvate lyase
MAISRQRLYGLTSLLAQFDLTKRDLGTFEWVRGPEVPEPQRSLLVHTGHMTVTLEAYYKSPVRVHVLDRRFDETIYARLIQLSKESNERIVQFGIMRINLDYCSAEVRDQIVSGEIPLGRILIKHIEMRCVDPLWYAKIAPSDRLTAYLGLERPDTVYGRVAMIYCDVKTTVELLEIVAP